MVAPQPKIYLEASEAEYMCKSEAALRGAFGEHSPSDFENLCFARPRPEKIPPLEKTSILTKTVTTL
jgi:hypothetical protein